MPRSGSAPRGRRRRRQPQNGAPRALDLRSIAASFGQSPKRASLRCEPGRNLGTPPGRVPTPALRTGLQSCFESAARRATSYSPLHPKQATQGGEVYHSEHSWQLRGSKPIQKLGRSRRRDLVRASGSRGERSGSAVAVARDRPVVRRVGSWQPAGRDDLPRSRVVALSSGE